MPENLNATIHDAVLERMRTQLTEFVAEQYGDVEGAEPTGGLLCSPQGNWWVEILFTFRSVSKPGRHWTTTYWIRPVKASPDGMVAYDTTDEALDHDDQHADDLEGALP